MSLNPVRNGSVVSCILTSVVVLQLVMVLLVHESNFVRSVVAPSVLRNVPSIPPSERQWVLLVSVRSVMTIFGY